MNVNINHEKFAHLKQEKSVEKKYTILVVDDETANVEALAMILDEYNVLKAKDGVEALAILRNEADPSRISLIISDQRMPEMGGVELLKQTIEIIPDAMRIILTGFTDVNDIIDAINEGHIYNFLRKPIEPHELLVSVKRALEAYELGIQNVRLIQKMKQLNENLEKRVEERTKQLLESIEAIKKQKSELEYMIKLKNKLVSELQLLSVTDSLTGVANRRRLMDYIEMEWTRATREKNKIALIMIDIDYFKAYNDFYGHAMGDRCLTRIANIIQQELKGPADILARYGGEEFCCILPETILEEAITIAKNIWQAICLAAIPHESSLICDHVTVSLGVHAIAPDAGNSWEELFAHADKYLYQAKSEGRNRIYWGKGEA